MADLPRDTPEKSDKLVEALRAMAVTSLAKRDSEQAGILHAAADRIVQLTVPSETAEHVAWCRYVSGPTATAIVLCDSDTPKAFKVYRSSPSAEQNIVQVLPLKPQPETVTTATDGPTRYVSAGDAPEKQCLRALTDGRCSFPHCACPPSAAPQELQTDGPTLGAPGRNPVEVTRPLSDGEAPAGAAPFDKPSGSYSEDDWREAMAKIPNLRKELERRQQIYANACAQVVGLRVTAFHTLEEGIAKLAALPSATRRDIIEECAKVIDRLPGTALPSACAAKVRALAKVRGYVGNESKP